MVELTQMYYGIPAIVIVWTKEECTKSLSKYPNFVKSEEVGFWIRKYFYKASKEEREQFLLLRNEAHAG